MNQHSATRSMFDPALVRPAIVESFKKLTPRTQFRNPVMFCVYVGSVLTTILWIAALAGQAEAPAGFILAVTLWLWFTVLFANFAEALAEGRSKAQAASLRSAKKDVMAKKLGEPRRDAPVRVTTASDLRRGDVVLVEAGDTIPADGEVVDGVASVDESAITGESAPVIRESGGDFSSVTGGTRVLSDWIVVKVTANPGEAFLDRMIAMVEGAKRQKTPNEIALTILLVALTIVMLLATATLLPFSIFSVQAMGAGHVVTITALVALLVCLIPTTIGGLLSAIGVAGMSRMMQANVIATSGRAVEAAGDVDVLLLDKTGTITLGNRQASEFVPAAGVAEETLADAAQLASLADETPEGRSIVVLAKTRFNLRQRDMAALRATFIGFSAQTRMSGVDLPEREIRKGAADAIRQYVEAHGARFPEDVRRAVDDIARRGSTPLVVAERHGDATRVLGVIELKDIVKGGIKERFAELRKMGIKTVMVTGDNRLTAAAIAAEAGVDDFLAEATPETKLATIREHQSAGRLVAMTGDGTNDAPALAQADVAVAMNTGTQAAKEAGNMVDLDSNPTKLIEIVEIGKQMLMTRGSLTTFSIANDVAKYFAIIPAAFATTYPQLDALNVMHLATPASAIMSAVIFNALIIVLLIPLALKGVRYRALGAATLLRRNLLVYGLGGILVPFVGIKLIDIVLAALGWV
ncbi:potassium-transporting ATPase subunit KdpB [Burkholderia glumae]|uniref:Potassium-transporting ATPase ATP-binding subunit n=1 Tax=Burkholderia glumae TaxID=337 RepID=A0AAP9Y133_BURGL|nr:potassium-transporting ATPase subunit KdpB [Burkholderia glumae]ACR29702.1 potassium-transporting ATPase subunit B [Burkholderia glumae BGR1]AJY67146.1 K+-transporting ATPase, B subunit [Burkholderia glumae LMG 2196 = ATCC 33617]KHJ61149.1 potassium-transporting ATPase subunit B [Burkholderia glumae]MCM2482629.1 potassium-transporting ATPase subunit KdpB [Burkholderia glumae]MCM2490723.1 potassium-transporting ATPase subunit KdpB [Burkholderia glumae]